MYLYPSSCSLTTPILKGSMRSSLQQKSKNNQHLSVLPSQDHPMLSSQTIGRRIKKWQCTWKTAALQILDTKNVSSNLPTTNPFFALHLNSTILIVQCLVSVLCRVCGANHPSSLLWFELSGIHWQWEISEFQQELGRKWSKPWVTVNYCEFLILMVNIGP